MLPTDAKARKAIPIYSGFIKYFPLAIAAVAELSRIGNDQHNPGKPLFWDRSKSGDELDAQMRHVLDEAAGVAEDTDGVKHLTKNAWRAMAALQKALEKERDSQATAACEVIDFGSTAQNRIKLPTGGLCALCGEARADQGQGSFLERRW
jgi:hypothetical protein